MNDLFPAFNHNCKLSQAQLAKATGLSHAAIVYWENGQRVPNANAVIILAAFFNVTTDYCSALKSSEE